MKGMLGVEIHLPTVSVHTKDISSFKCEDVAESFCICEDTTESACGERPWVERDHGWTCKIPTCSQVNPPETNLSLGGSLVVDLLETGVRELIKLVAGFLLFLQVVLEVRDQFLQHLRQRSTGQGLTSEKFTIYGLRT